MENENFMMLENVVTPEAVVEIRAKDVVFTGSGKYLDADDELRQIADYIKMNTKHNSDIKPERIKYLYTTNAKKDGGRYVLGSLSLRSDVEKIINDDYDYILSVHYKSWKELDMKNKVIQLDKILCGINIDEDDNVKKQAVDSKEFINNLRHYGPKVVLDSSEIVDIAVSRIVEEEKEERKSNK